MKIAWKPRCWREHSHQCSKARRGRYPDPQQQPRRRGRTRCFGDRNGGKAVALKLDVSKTSSFGDFAALVEQALQNEWQQKTFDYLVNNAGIAQRTLIKDLSEDLFDQLVNVHFKGPVFLTQKLLPLMSDGGHVVNISIAMTRVASSAGTSIYSSAKGAMEVFTRFVAREFLERKIRCNIVAPGALDTDFGGGRTDEMRKRLGEATTTGRSSDRSASF
jgi:NAD(P)-dependent dehydrogenase (short-subunit alcohol dehydrogenase family)